MVTKISEKVMKKIDQDDRLTIQKATEIILGNRTEAGIRAKKIINGKAYLISYKGAIEMNIVDVINSFYKNSIRIEQACLYYRDGVGHLGFVIPKRDSKEAAGNATPVNENYGDSCKKAAFEHIANLLSKRDQRFDWFVELLQVLYFTEPQLISCGKDIIETNGMKQLRLVITHQMCPDIDHSFDILSIYLALYHLKSKYSEIIALLSVRSSPLEPCCIDVGFLHSSINPNRPNVVDSIVERHTLDQPLDSEGGLDRFSQGRSISLRSPLINSSALLASPSVSILQSASHSQPFHPGYSMNLGNSVRAPIDSILHSHSIQPHPVHSQPVQMYPSRQHSVRSDIHTTKPSVSSSIHMRQPQRPDIPLPMRNGIQKKKKKKSLIRNVYEFFTGGDGDSD